MNSKKFGKYFVVGTVLLLPLAANADDHMANDEGFYAGLGGGMMAIKGFASDSGNSKSDADLENGIRISAFAGYDFGSFRAEGEFSYSDNDTDHLNNANLNKGADTDVSGDIKRLSLMINGYYDIDLKDVPITPYIGLGVGLTREKMDVEVAGVSAANGGMVNDSDTVLAAQAIVGADLYSFGASTVFADYRLGYLAKTKRKSSSGETQEDDAKYSHSVILGLKYKF